MSEPLSAVRARVQKKAEAMADIAREQTGSAIEAAALLELASRTLFNQLVAQKLLTPQQVDAVMDYAHKRTTDGR